MDRSISPPPARLYRVVDAAPRALPVGLEQGCLPKLFCDLNWCNLNVGPPRDLVAMAMQVAMMFAAQRHGEFVADLASERSGLGKFQMMRIAG